MTDPLAVVAYLRVSSQGQADSGHGLEAQEAGAARTPAWRVTTWSA